jgi:hypothetical protein
MSRILHFFKRKSGTRFSVSSSLFSQICSVKDPKRFGYWYHTFFQNIFVGNFLFFLFVYIEHCFICRPSDSTVPTDAGIEPMTVATGALAISIILSGASNCFFLGSTVLAK